MDFLKRVFGKRDDKAVGESPAHPGTARLPPRQVELAGYGFNLPEGFADPEIKPTEHFSILKTAATKDVTFDVLVAPGGGDKAIDGYFGSALRRFEDGRPRGFDLEHMGQHFRGWLIDQSPTLSTAPESFIQYYGTVAYGDAICLSWAAFGPLPADADFETLFLTIVYSAIVRRGQALNSSQAAHSARDS